MSPRTVRRLLLTPPATLGAEPGREWLEVPVCTCVHDRRRGPVDGVCGACGGGIPTPAERAAMDGPPTWGIS